MGQAGIPGLKRTHQEEKEGRGGGEAGGESGGGQAGGGQVGDGGEVGGGEAARLQPAAALAKSQDK